MTNPLAPLNRRQFFWHIVGWVLLQVAGSVLVNFVTLPSTVTRGVNTAFTVYLAFLVSARLTDAGYRWWLGPVVLGLLVVLAFVAGFFTDLPALIVIPCLLAVMLVFIVWVGTRRSVVQPVDWSDQFADDDGDRRRGQRIEPRF